MSAVQEAAEESDGLEPRTIQFRAFVSELEDPCDTMILTAACLGLRACEVLRLKWPDLDFENLTIRIQRSVSEGEINNTKTESSEATLPLDQDLAEFLLMHKKRSVYTTGSDYIFAGSTGS